MRLGWMTFKRTKSEGKKLRAKRENEKTLLLRQSDRDPGVPLQLLSRNYILNCLRPEGSPGEVPQLKTMEATVQVIKVVKVVLRGGRLLHLSKTSKARVRLIQKRRIRESLRRLRMKSFNCS